MLSANSSPPQSAHMPGADMSSYARTFQGDVIMQVKLAVQ